MLVQENRRHAGEIGIALAGKSSTRGARKRAGLLTSGEKRDGGGAAERIGLAISAKNRICTGVPAGG